jgi:hypothetical protein
MLANIGIMQSAAYISRATLELQPGERRLAHPLRLLPGFQAVLIARRHNFRLCRRFPSFLLACIWR